MHTSLSKMPNYSMIFERVASAEIGTAEYQDILTQIAAFVARSPGEVAGIIEEKDALRLLAAEPVTSPMVMGILMRAAYRAYRPHKPLDFRATTSQQI
jgi:hypothetical protein